jgi:EAL domain-containing protein (putative c-di-GMP-specific phosphodiesterase class I)/PAS domain-containing protein
MFHRRSEFALIGPNGDLIWHKKAYGEEPHESLLHKLHHLYHAEHAVVPRSSGAIDWLSRFDFNVDGSRHRLISRYGHSHLAMPTDHLSHKVFVSGADGHFIDPIPTERGTEEATCFRQHFEPFESPLENVSIEILLHEALDSGQPIQLTTLHPPNLVKTLRVFPVFETSTPVIVWVFDSHVVLQIGTVSEESTYTSFSGIGYVECDSDGTILKCNRALKLLLREVRTELEPGKNFWKALNLLVERHPEAAELILDRTPDDSSVHPGSDGRILIVRESSLPDGRFARAYIDITTAVRPVGEPIKPEAVTVEPVVPRELLDGLQQTTQTAIFYFSLNDSNPTWIANPAYLLPKDSRNIESAETLRIHPSDWESLKVSLADAPTSGASFGDRRVRLVSDTGFIAWVRLLFTRSLQGYKANTYLGVAVAAEPVASLRHQSASQTESGSHATLVITDEDVQAAIANNEFELHYQPIVDALTEEPQSLEALLRWRKPDGTFVRPNQFLPAIERSALMVEVGKWVVRHACEDSQKIHQQIDREIPIFVNVAVRQLRSRFIRDYEVAVSSFSIPNKLLGIEITESSLGEGSRQMKETLQQLRKIGCSIAMDDFGTGFSSLAYLKEFPIQIVKLDSWFSRELDHNPRDQAIFRAIQQLCESLELKIVAEGIERKAQADWLREAGCDLAQGYYYCRPLPRNELLEWMSLVRR